MKKNKKKNFGRKDWKKWDERKTATPQNTRWATQMGRGTEPPIKHSWTPGPDTVIVSAQHATRGAGPGGSYNALSAGDLEGLGRLGEAPALRRLTLNLRHVGRHYAALGRLKEALGPRAPPPGPRPPPHTSSPLAGWLVCAVAGFWGVGVPWGRDWGSS